MSTVELNLYTYGELTQDGAIKIDTYIGEGCSPNSTTTISLSELIEQEIDFNKSAGKIKKHDANYLRELLMNVERNVSLSVSMAMDEIRQCEEC